MRIGLFTDSYHPAANGVVLTVDMARRELEKLGHEVYIFAPDGGVIRDKKLRRNLPRDPHIIRLPAIQYDMQLSLFFPPQLLKRIRALKLDVIQFFTPAQIGLMATLAARKTGAVLIGKHGTDTYEFSKDYRAMALAYFFAGFLGPLFIKLSSAQKKTFAKLYLAPLGRETDEKYTQRLIAGLMSLMYANCDGVVAVSEKSAKQLREFAARSGEKLNLRVIPDGVDVLPPAREADIKKFHEKWKLSPDDEIILNFGRMAEEKNLTLLIDMLPMLLTTHPHAKLILAGDYVYRETLEEIAKDSPVADRISFTGRYARDEIPTMCAVAKLFAFSSLTDTQALVLNEAAGQGLPIVMCDNLGVNDVFRENENGLFAKNELQDFANQVAKILDDEKLRKKFSTNSRKFAAEFSESQQTEKLVAFYRELLRRPIK